MRMFWVLMLVLTLAAAGVLASRYVKDFGPDPNLVAQRTMAPDDAERSRPAVGSTLFSDKDAERHSTEATPLPTIPIDDAPAEATAEATALEDAAPQAIADAPTTTEPLILAPTLDQLLGLDEAAPITEAADEEQETPETTVATGASPSAKPPPQGEELAGGVVLSDEGHLIVAGRFAVPGKGTAEDPYVLSWSVLLAVQEHYRPRQGLTEIPPWINFFEDKHVRLAGFVLPPMMGDDMREVLLMQNEWDGCCVGVPPTPYDAVEVKLTRNPRGLSQYTMNYGEITGVFKVDPFVQGEWLLGLYLMDKADLVIKGF